MLLDALMLDQLYKKVTSTITYFAAIAGVDRKVHVGMLYKHPREANLFLIDIIYLYVRTYCTCKIDCVTFDFSLCIEHCMLHAK